MVNLFIFAFIAYGFSNIIVYGSIFEPWRNFCYKISPASIGKLFSCMMCISWWVGLISSFYFFSPCMTYGFANGYWAHLFDGFFTSGIVWLLHTLQEYLERK